MATALLCDLTTNLSSTVSSDPTGSHLFRAAERLRRKPDLVRRKLRAIREQPEIHAELASQAYWHSNGFAKIKMAEAHSFCVRLHIWPAGPDRRGEVDPHGHRWEFASWVAAGEGMSERRFEPATDPNLPGVPYTRCSYGRENGAPFLRPAETVWLREVGEYRRTPSHVYGCDREVIHTVAPIGTGLVATVVLQGPVHPAPANVYRFSGQSFDAPQRPISPSELDQLFADVENALPAGDTDTTS
jgi:hypothetical protein